MNNADAPDMVVDALGFPDPTPFVYPRMGVAPLGSDPGSEEEMYMTRVDLGLVGGHADAVQRRASAGELTVVAFRWPEPRNEQDEDNFADVRSEQISRGLLRVLGKFPSVILAGDATGVNWSKVYLYRPAGVDRGALETGLRGIQPLAPTAIDHSSDPDWTVFDAELAPTPHDRTQGRLAACFAPLLGLGEELELEREVVLFYLFADAAAAEAALRAAIKAGLSAVPARGNYEIGDTDPSDPRSALTDRTLGVRFRSTLIPRDLSDLTDRADEILVPLGGVFTEFDTEIFNADDED